MIQRRICKSNRILLSYTSPIGTCKVSQQQSPMCQGKNKSNKKSTVFNGMENGTPPYRWELNPSISVINYELDEKFARDKLMFRL